MIVCVFACCVLCLLLYVYGVLFICVVWCCVCLSMFVNVVGVVC